MTEEGGLVLLMYRWKTMILEKQKNYLHAALKVFRALADNLNNGGLLTAPAGKTNVTAS